MENNDRRQEERLAPDKDTQIKLTVVNPDNEEDEINFGRVFHRFKVKRRIYAWLLLACLAAGMSAGLLMYQITKKPLTVSSVVTLRYKVKDNIRANGAYDLVDVTDLTAPDGENELDLNQITSAYVLQNALSGMKLSQPITLSVLRGNIGIERILTEDSRRKQELASKMIDNTSTMAAGYQSAKDLQLVYTNQFVVSLTNGFSEEDSDDRRKMYLEDEELQTLLDRILKAYNDYLILTYADIRLPDDEISVIDTANLDILESLDLLRLAVRNLKTYCSEMNDDLRAYRSPITGLSLNELMIKIDLVQETRVDYLYSYVYTNSIVQDPASMITQYQYELRNAQTQLDVINENIATTRNILETYKNDEIFVSMQESDSSRSTKATTDYYNNLILTQAENYEAATEMEIRIIDLEDKISNLSFKQTKEESEWALEELEKTVSVSQTVYSQVLNHMEEMIASPECRIYAEATVAHGKTENFLKASIKNMIILGALGVIAALGIWVLSALAPEFRVSEDEEEKNGKKVTAE